MTAPIRELLTPCLVCGVRVIALTLDPATEGRPVLMWYARCQKCGARISVSATAPAKEGER